MWNDWRGSLASAVLRGASFAVWSIENLLSPRMDTTTDNTSYSYLLVCYVGSSRNSYMMYEYAYYELIVYCTLE